MWINLRVNLYMRRWLIPFRMYWVIIEGLNCEFIFSSMSNWSTFCHMPFKIVVASFRIALVPKRKSFANDFSSLGIIRWSSSCWSILISRRLSLKNTSHWSTHSWCSRRNVSSIRGVVIHVDCLFASTFSMHCRLDSRHSRTHNVIF